MRINKAVELLAQGQPVYFEFVDADSAGGYDGGRALAQTWADYITYDMEHSAFDVHGLAQFMRGLVEGGPTPSGHRSPAVIVTLPIDGTDAQTVRANGWMIKQALAAGVHGLLLCHAESADAVRAFVEAARYAFRAQIAADLGPGRRGHGGQTHAAEMWGVTPTEYMACADPWPLDAQGELLLGIKVENKRALAEVERTTRVPGLAFAEWGPGDMGMSFGYPDQHDEPYPAEMREARTRILAACKAAHLAFLETVTPQNVVAKLAEGVRIGCGPQAREAAKIGRQHTGRTMPW
ncbi:MAG TPA: aldolase/citrate lyase family protein [Burkholderiales bacterium]|nr:aldolase/citrate lyase family protein [Burkholderiales bacterium]